MLVRRSQIVTEEFGMGAYTGFRPDRSTIDEFLSIFVGLHRRHDYGLETWALFIDLFT